MGEKILEMRGIAKSFSSVYALKNAQLSLEKGNVMALVGENGAGKSTLMRILTGIYDYDEGEIFYKGEKVRFKNAMESRNAGIAIIHQEFNLFPNLTAAENIFLEDKAIRRRGLIEWKTMNTKAQQLVDSIGGAFSVTEKVQDLTVQNQQVVEIVKALAANAEIIVMDEPTSALPESEVQHLFTTIRGL
ncbi:MAG: ATP-binding cassette domain-containing protein, partial [Oscillospiraceae bacterium]|nr:ATP-binding cassette domain-containing protein [Oscillospiraceae bacterium]